MSPVERQVWNALRSRQHGFKFRRQHPIAGFYVDFYCDEARVAVELDGASHENSAIYDAERDARLMEMGILTVRVTYAELDDIFAGALDRILDACRRRTLSGA